MKRNAKINSRKLSLICLVLTLVIAMTAIFVVTASAADGTWELVTNVSELAAGDKVIIAAKDSAVALGTTQNNNNRNQGTITKNGNTVTFSSGVQELTLEEGTVAGSFAFNTGSGYLYAASSSKNYLRTETTKSANSSWVITIDNAGTATVKAQGTNTRNLMQYNKSSSIFASYSGAQQSIVIYKFHAASAPVVPDCEHPNKTTTTIPADCTTAGSTKVVCDDCGFEISNTEIPALGHNYVDGVCSVCGEEEPVGYKLVSDVTSLKVGDKIVIVANGYDKALGTEQANNNRKAVEITKGDGVVTFGDNVEIITLEAGASAGTFAFKATAGYLYAAGGGNYLRSQATVNANASWTISIAGGVATIKSSASVSQNWLRYNSNNDIFSCYGSGQQDISIYKMPAAEPETPVECPHTNQTTTTNPAKCESDGSTVVTCDDCGFEISRTPIPATGHVNTTETTVDSTCTTNGSVTVTCNDCGKSLGTESLPKAAHNYNADGICGVCGFDKNDKGFSGKYYILAIRSSGNYFAMINDLGTADTKRYTALDAEATELPEFITSDDADSKAIFVLEIQEDGTYLIYAEGIEENNYLGWTSGNSGTFVAKENAVKFTVDKLESGLFNIHFTADYERYLALNNNTGSDYFAFYKSGQKQDLTLLPIIEETEDPENPEGNNPDNPGEPECKHEAIFNSAGVNIGDSLSLKCFLTLCEHDDIANYKMVFTMNENTVTVASYEEFPAGHLFVFSGIAPQCMGDNIKIEVLHNDAVVENLTVKNYSILTNFKALLEKNADDEKLKTLIYNTLAYGAEAQKYTGYKTGALVNAGFEALATQNAQPTDAHVLSALKDGATASFKSAAVEFGDVNKIIVKINAADVANVTLKVGETALTLTEVSDGVYAATTDAISALNLGAKVGFNLYVGEDLVQTLTYSVNDYASRKWDDAEMGALVKALYNYGVAARLYWAIPEKN